MIDVLTDSVTAAQALRWVIVVAIVLGLSVALYCGALDNQALRAANRRHLDRIAGLELTTTRLAARRPPLVAGPAIDWKSQINDWAAAYDASWSYPPAGEPVAVGFDGAGYDDRFGLVVATMTPAGHVRIRAGLPGVVRGDRS